MVGGGGRHPRPAYLDLLTNPVFLKDGTLEYLAVRDGKVYKAQHLP